MKRGDSPLKLHFEALLSAVLAVFGHLCNTIVVCQATSVKSLADSTQNVLQPSSWFVIQTETINLIASSAASRSVFTTYGSTIPSTTIQTLIQKSTLLPTSTRVYYKPTVTPSQTGTVTPTSPATVSRNRNGLPSGKVVAAIAGVLGVILFILMSVIVWNLCFAHVFATRRRHSARIQPATESVGGIVDHSL